jgi:hypothetical protein
MKGLLFGGCSFTWGQGLYFYSDLNRLVYPENEFTYKREDLNDAHLRFKDTLRYPRLVANHFKTFEVVKNVNGGSEDETFDFFKTMFEVPRHTQLSHYHLDRFDYDDFDYIVIQLSQIWRNKFYFTLDGEEDFAYVSANNNHHGYNWDRLLEWLTVNDETVENVIETLFKEQHKRLLNEVKFYEEKGIKVIILSWEDEYYNILKNDSYLMERYIRLTYKDETYNTIREMHNKNPHLKIKGDVAFFGDNVPDDHHPSKECHEVIAQNIIRRIESELK